MRPICEFEKLAFDSEIVWSHGRLLRFKVVIDGVAFSTKQENVQKIDLDVVAFSKRAHVPGLAVLGTRLLRAFAFKFPVVSTALGTNACAFCMMSFARIAVSASALGQLTCDVSGLAALGTRALGVCVRFAVVSLCLACGAKAWTILVWNRSHARQSHNDRKP